MNDLPERAFILADRAGRSIVRTPGSRRRRGCGVGPAFVEASASTARPAETEAGALDSIRSCVATGPRSCHGADRRDGLPALAHGAGQRVQQRCADCSARQQDRGTAPAATVRKAGSARLRRGHPLHDSGKASPKRQRRRAIGTRRLTQLPGTHPFFDARHLRVSSGASVLRVGVSTSRAPRETSNHRVSGLEP